MHAKEIDPKTKISSIELTQDQEKALELIFDWLKKDKSFSDKFLIISGYAGTGKTTLISYLRHQLKQTALFTDLKVAFCSFTGKAASVLRQKLTEANSLFKSDSCGTIHSLIYSPVLDKEDRIISWQKLPEIEADLIIVDEGSMINSTIWNDLTSYDIPILVVGDHGQLPPIGGQFNLMQNANFKIQQIVRQAADNPIIQLSIRIREGGGIPYENLLGDAVKKYSPNDPDFEEILKSAVLNNLDDYLCICGRNRTRMALNNRIRFYQDRYEPEPVIGERIICLKNNHMVGIYNGMIGNIVDISPFEKHWYELCIDFDEKNLFEGKALKYQFGLEKTLSDPIPANIPIKSSKDFENLFDYGYALTAHKAQGSEANQVIVFEERMYQASDEDWQRWLYTAVTRAREKLIVFG